jgi:hypothetical protein
MDVFSQQNTSQGARLYKFNGQTVNSTGITDDFRSHAFGIYLLDMKAKLKNNE